MSSGIVGILLAAGQSRRFGSNKLLHGLEGGPPMVIASVRRLTAVLPRTLAVVADAHNGVARLLQSEGVELVVNGNAAAGMGTSIACGVQASGDAQGWLIALGDMPYVPEVVVARLHDLLRQGRELVAPVYRQRRGHPVGFSARFGPELASLDNDCGARELIQRNRHALTAVEVDTDGVLVDIDTRHRVTVERPVDR